MPKMKPDQLKKLCLLTTYGCQLDLMREDGISMSSAEAHEVLQAALACLPPVVEGIPVVGEDFIFCFQDDDKGYFDPSREMKVPVWNVFLFHKDKSLHVSRSYELEEYISIDDLNDLGIGGDCMENCYSTEGTTRREIKDRLEKAGFTYQSWGRGKRPSEEWMTYPDLDLEAVPEEPWELL